jgi:hypothetical protein
LEISGLQFIRFAFLRKGIISLQNLSSKDGNEALILSIFFVCHLIDQPRIVIFSQSFHPIFIRFCPSRSSHTWAILTGYLQMSFSHINQLPEEILIHIVSCLSHLSDLKSATLTCKLWHSILVDENYPWRKAYENIWRSVPYERVHPDSWKREYVDRWRQWRRWQYKHPSSDVYLNPDLGPLYGIHPSSIENAPLASLDNMEMAEIKFNVVSLLNGLVRPCRIFKGQQGKVLKETFSCLSRDGFGIPPSCMNLDLDDRVLCGFSNGSVWVVSCIIPGMVSNARWSSLAHRHASSATILFLKTWKTKRFVSLDSEGFFVLWRWETTLPSSSSSSSSAVVEYACQARRARPSSLTLGKDVLAIGYEDNVISLYKFGANQDTVVASEFTIKTQTRNLHFLSLRCGSFVVNQCDARVEIFACKDDPAGDGDGDGGDKGYSWISVLKTNIIPDDGDGDQPSISTVKIHVTDYEGCSFLLVIGDESGLVTLYHVMADTSDPRSGMVEMIIKEEKSFKGLQGRIDCICVDEFHVAAAGSSSADIRVWDICSGTTLKQQSAL